ncbi:hypothetical protein [Rhizorhabdus histidinilytica]|uniref:Uncharacterized protein n=1 Tax=Rhizorhabdus histidinilytica TaxID=439228 RepID=A0A1T5BPC5_9SPHN|nr:hypothetical protein [Rhizorhabdus histidinilytica]SKB48760.1 hypothetical protein SAMN06295920_103149 [Rhizorhabdus histidinilytica]
MTPDTPRPHCLNRDACTAAKPTSHCRRCNAIAVNASPDHRAKCSAAMRERYQDAAFKAEHTEKVRHAIKRAAKDPEWLARKREVGRRYGAPNLLSGHTTESRRKAGPRISATKLSHIPEHLRDEYRKLSRTKGLTKAERIEVINGIIDIERRASPEAEGRRIVERITREMEAKERRRKAQAY